MHPTPDWLNQIKRLPEIDLNIKFFGGHQQWVPIHWVAEKEKHFAFEIAIILQGIQRTFYDGYYVDYHEGDIVLIPPGTSHEKHSFSEEGSTYFSVHFDIDEPEIQHLILMYCPLLLSEHNPAYPSIKQTLASFIELIEVSNTTIKYKLIIIRLLIDLVSFLLDYSEEERLKIDLSDNTTLIQAKEIAETIQSNYQAYTANPILENNDLLSIDMTAETLNISNSTMLKVFKKVYSMSPKQYLDMLKYNDAKSLLNQPKPSIGEIAEIIGYQNTSHFSRQFKKWSGFSPTEYRNRLQHSSF